MLGQVPAGVAGVVGCGRNLVRTCTGLSAAGGVLNPCPAVGRLAKVSGHLGLPALQTHNLERPAEQRAGDGREQWS